MAQDGARRAVEDDGERIARHAAGGRIEQRAGDLGPPEERIVPAPLAARELLEELRGLARLAVLADAAQRRSSCCRPRPAITSGSSGRRMATQRPARRLTALVEVAGEQGEDAVASPGGRRRRTASASRRAGEKQRGLRRPGFGGSRPPRRAMRAAPAARRRSAGRPGSRRKTTPAGREPGCGCPPWGEVTTSSCSSAAWPQIRCTSATASR